MSLILDGTLGITNPAGSTTLLTAPTRQVFLTGTSATYTTPSGCRRIVVREKAGGGGGAGCGSTGPNVGTVGGTTTFNSISASGGGAGTHANNGAGASGGTGGAGTASVRIAGASAGTLGVIFTSATNVATLGGNGGGQGSGRGSNSGAAGTAGVANSGGGGGGGGASSLTFLAQSGIYFADAGGEGEYAEITITSPAATYTYSVGAGGAAGGAGTSGYAGGAGGSGYIIVDEYY